MSVDVSHRLFSRRELLLMGAAGVITLAGSVSVSRSHQHRGRRILRLLMKEESNEFLQ